jgi:adenylosuccinate lyase
MSEIDNPHASYRSPLASRYASQAMRELFSAQRKHSTWRRLWLALAESQKELGLEIPDAAIEQMRAHLDDIDFDAASRYESRFRHDVMAHIHAFGDVAPAAAGIIHLGATSQFVNCNTDMLQIREGLGIIRDYLAGIVDALGGFAAEHRDLPCLGFTHFQPAQMVTVGKRATLWCYDFVRDLGEIEHRLETLEFRSVKGTTGTQASFLALFDGDHEKVTQLERMVADKMGFDRIAPVTGQTYSRKVDGQVAQNLAQVAVSVHKFANDVRLLAHKKEMEEPFASTQVGSSAMAYKRNPMRCERATALARWLIDISASPMHTAAEQWLERTLDDSANKRLAMSEAFLTADAICRIILNVAGGLVVYPAVIEAHVRQELPFMATENILMAAVRAGGDRQELHEKIRRHSQDAAREVKEKGRQNDLIERLQADEAFSSLDFDSLLEPSTFTGRSAEQVDEFLSRTVEPIRSRYGHALKAQEDLKV